MKSEKVTAQQLRKVLGAIHPADALDNERWKGLEEKAQEAFGEAGLKAMPDRKLTRQAALLLQELGSRVGVHEAMLLLWSVLASTVVSHVDGASGEQLASMLKDAVHGGDTHGWKRTVTVVTNATALLREEAAKAGDVKQGLKRAIDKLVAAGHAADGTHAGVEEALRILADDNAAMLLALVAGTAQAVAARPELMEEQLLKAITTAGVMALDNLEAAGIDFTNERGDKLTSAGMKLLAAGSSTMVADLLELFTSLDAVMASNEVGEA